MQRPDSPLAPQLVAAGTPFPHAVSAPVMDPASRQPLGQTEWAAVVEAAVHFHRSEWFIRKTANEMSQLKVGGHPIKAGGSWLIDIGAMTAYFAVNAEKAASHSRYPMSEPDASATHIRDDEDWRWS